MYFPNSKSDSESFYKILGVSENDSKEDIRKAYRKLSLQHHPDRNPNNPESKAIFQKISEAYETLGDDQKREEYNQTQRNPFMRMNSHSHGAPFRSPFQNSTGMDFPVDEIFKAFFGGDDSNGFPGFPGFPGGANQFSTTMGPGGNIHIFTTNGGRPNFKKPTPIIKTIEVSFNQVLSGCTIPLSIERWLLENNNKVFENETLYVDIPKGIDENEIIILRDKGNILNDDIKGDVKIFIKVVNNTPFKREGLNLLLTKTISLKDALCGFTFELKHLSNKTYTLNCNSGTIIYPGYKKELPNMGLTRDNNTGNLIIEFHVEFPETFTEDQIRKLKDII